MSNMNQCNFTGRLTDKPYQGSGMISFDIALNSKRGDTEYTEYVSIKTFGKIAESIGPHLEKGSHVRVSAEFRTRVAEVEGVKRKFPEFIIQNFDGFEFL